ncbi:MAG: type II toxin-antitoxin system VapC family toxin [Gaiellaceae bacterium]
MIVLDSSAAVDFVARLGFGEWVGAAIRAEPTVHAPHVLDVEVLGALRRLVLRALITEDEAHGALEDFKALRVRRYPHVPFVARIWELRQTLSPPDAAFVALAEALDARLVTTDQRLARAPGLAVEVLAP